MGWRIGSTWTPASNRLEIAVSDATGRPLAGARVSAELVRPVEKRAPVPLALGAEDGGKFAGFVDLPVRGNWDLDVVIEYDGHRFAQTRRLFLK